MPANPAARLFVRVTMLLRQGGPGLLVRKLRGRLRRSR
jgi:hypothetical protein